MLLFNILLLYRNCAIVGNSGKPFQKVSVIYWNYYYHDSIYLTDFYAYYFILGFHDRIYVQHKNKKQHRRGTIWHTGSQYLTREKFEGQENHWEHYYFSVVNRPVVLWLSWSITVTNQS